MSLDDYQPLLSLIYGSVPCSSRNLTTLGLFALASAYCACVSSAITSTELHIRTCNRVLPLLPLISDGDANLSANSVRNAGRLPTRAYWKTGESGSMTRGTSSVNLVVLNDVITANSGSML